MPLPVPERGEDHEHFMGRCMSDMHREFPDPAQRQAVCERQWREDHEEARTIMRYSHIMRWFQSTTWAILPEKLAVMADALAFLASGGEYTAEEIAVIAGRPREASRVRGSVAVLPLVGVISHRANMVSEASGGTSVQGFASAFRQLVADPSVGALILDVDSPGGSVEGIEELGAELYRAREEKPVVAVANALMASAAYWVGSAASELVATPTALLGSIGVYTVHDDLSAVYERVGVRRTVISAGKHKTEGLDHEPLADDARAAVQEMVDEYYGMFVSAVARNRGVPASEVRNGYGEGRVVTARQAKALGMVDRIGTLDETIERLAGRSRRASLSTMAARVRLAERGIV